MSTYGQTWVQGGGDSDTVSVLSQHHSLKPEPEVTGPQEASRGQPDPSHSEASKVRKVRHLSALKPA